MKDWLKKNNKLLGTVMLAIFLFALGAGIGSLPEKGPKILEEEASDNLNMETEALATKEELPTFKSSIAYKDELIAKEIDQFEEESGELYISVKDLADIIGADIQWNGISKQFILKRDENYIIVDTAKKILIDAEGTESKVTLYGSEKNALVPVSKTVSNFGYQLSKLDELGIFRIKTPDVELLDIEFSKEHQASFGVEIEDYEAKYRREKALFEEQYPEKKEPMVMKEIPDGKVAYLTFDDGPNANTLSILEILKNHGIKGTFFVLGNNIYGNEHILKQTYDEGHSIGLHSMNHVYKQVYASPESFVSQMDQCNELVESVTGLKTKLIRPPYGSKPQLTENFRTAAVNGGYRVWDWNIDSKDAVGGNGKNGVYNSTVNQASRFEGPIIILFHDKSNTVGALPGIIEYLKGRGYSFEPITEDLLPFNFWKDKRYVD